MFDLFRTLRVEILYFWIGFASASFFWWLIVQLRPKLYSLFKRSQEKLQSVWLGIKSNNIEHHLASTLQNAQSLHLANQLFALDEILVPPRLLAPPVPAIPGQPAPVEDIVIQSIPYMPDWPELGTIYGSHTLSITQALSGGSNLAIIGPPGSGKTVTLATLASMAARSELEDPEMAERIPVLIHAFDLDLSSQDNHKNGSKSAMDIIAEAATVRASNIRQFRMSDFFSSLFNSGNALLLIDGLDELLPTRLKTVVNFIELLLQQYPHTRAVVATAPKLLDRLPSLGFVPLPLALWSRFQQAQFAQNWGAMWSNFIDTEQGAKIPNYSSVNPLLLNSWILNQDIVKSPLSFTLQIWAAYAGDIRGTSTADAFSAYLLRISIDIPGALEALSQIANKSVLLMQTTFTLNEAKQWISEEIPEMGVDNNNESKGEDTPALKGSAKHKVLYGLIDTGLLIPRASEQYSIYPEFVGYLASQELANSQIDDIFKQPNSAIKCLTLHHLASIRDIVDQAQLHLSQPPNQDPLLIGQLASGRWLSDIPLEASWRKPIMHQLAQILQDESQTMGTRTRVLTALILAKDPNLSALFQHLINSQKSSVRKLAALGLGTQYSAQAISSLSNLLQDFPEVSKAACLALVNIGTQPAMDAISNALMRGSEDLQKAAAEALANHPIEGHPILQEGAQLEDLLVQRAVIYGLRRIRQPWTLALLEKIQIEDGQWVVKNAAALAFEEMKLPDSRIPHVLPSLADTPWLISFAAQRDLGISPEKPDFKLLLHVLKEGTPAEQLAAMLQFQRHSYANIFPTIYTVLYGDAPDLSEAAYITLWTLAATGVDLPHPLKFGFR